MEASREFKIALCLHEKQRYIDDHATRFTIVRAGRKFGKTVYARKKALDWLGPPNGSVWYIGPTYKQTKLITWSAFKRMIPSQALKKKPNDTDLIITLKNGSELYLMGGDEPDSLKGPEPDAVIFEEAALMKPEIWHEVIRPNLTPKRSPALFISTPKGFNWFKDLEDGARLRIADGSPEWSVFHYTIYDNPHIARDEIEEARRDCEGDERYWRQEYLAEYESSVGRVFLSFSESRHIGEVPDFSGPWSRAVDWGLRDDTACLWGYVRGRTLYVKQEYADNNLPPSAQAGIILARTKKSMVVSRNIISHDSTKTDNEMRGLTVSSYFVKAGIRPLRPSSRNKEGSRSLLSQLFREDRILIDRSCLKLRKQLLAYEWKDTVMEKTVDERVDLVDALHYLAELHQYELGRENVLDESHEERVRKHHEELGKLSRFKLPDENEPDSVYAFSGPGGYL